MMDDFTILTKAVWLYAYSDRYFFNNFPKVHNELRQKFVKTVWELIEFTIKANLNEGNIRKKYQIDMQVCVIILDKISGIMHDKKLISDKRFYDYILTLNEISRMIYSWKNNGNKTKEEFVG